MLVTLSLLLVQTCSHTRFVQRYKVFNLLKKCSDTSLRLMYLTRVWSSDVSSLLFSHEIVTGMCTWMLCIHVTVASPADPFRVNGRQKNTKDVS